MSTTAGVEPRRRFEFGMVLTLAIGVFCLVNYVHPLVPLQERAIFAMLTAPALFLVTKPESDWRLWRLTDLFHAVLAAICFGYIVLDWEQILFRQGEPSPLDMYLGAVTIYILVVASLRSLGTGFTIFVLIFLAYTFFGGLLPNYLGGHRGYSLQRIFSFLFLSENGILGFIIDTCLKYMFLFLLLGKILERAGALRFIMEFGAALFPRGASGPPLMAVATSALVGTMTGSSMTNVYVAGTVTIPLMRRAGVSPELAAAIETAASNGSQIMPPVLGFAVFFMIVLLQISYFEIAVAAAIPGTLYFLSLGFTVWVRTRDLPVPDELARESAPRPLRQVLWSLGAFSFFGTLGGLMAFIATNVSIQTAVLYATAICLVLSWFGPDRVGPVQFVRAVESSARDLVPIAALCLALGLITGPILLTGLGTKMPALLLDWSSGQLWLLLIGAFVASLVMGTGLPTSTVYVIVALLIGNTMTSFGVPKLAAHLFVFYGALAASITPPVAMTAYVAATIANADYWKTGWLASFLGIPKYVLPFGFVYRPELLMRGRAIDIVAVTIMTAIGLFAMSYSAVLWRRGALGRASAAFTALAGFLLVVPPIDTLLCLAILASGAAGGILALLQMRLAHRSR
jgi:TRAP transporter 4TM/12TM fusion protein